MFNNKNILITGGTGSFGKKYTKILLEKYKPNKIIILHKSQNVLELPANYSKNIKLGDIISKKHFNIDE